ncbi:MAG: hypothetical protein BA066_02780 [Candidatus Korarchaeota archaeon NZ13-K]|nr:MAG: hypothetical protein BA066_02780 [Candidatus Korarchaeota archaeon NZ13-K]
MVRVPEDQLDRAIREMEELDDLREEALRRSRRWLSVARSSIISARRMNCLEDVERGLLEILGEVKRFMEEAMSRLGSSSCLIRPIIQDSLQEIVEGIVLCRLLAGKRVPDHAELGVGAREYLLGVSDAIGELRRIALECMREGNVEMAEGLVSLMEGIYERIGSASFPDSLIPLRKKADEARILIERTLSELLFVKAGRGSRIGSDEG